MISHILEKMYKRVAYRRYGEREDRCYFSHSDFSGVNMEKYSFKNKWGEDLSAYFYYPDNEIDGRIILFEHGLGAGHQSYMRQIVTLVNNGYRVFTYDHTGCGASAGESIKGLVGSLCDLDFCLRALKSDSKYADKRVSVIGHSWGGFSAMNIAKLHPELECVVAMSGFRSLDAILRQIMTGFKKPFIPKIFALEERVNPEYVSFDGGESLSATDCRVLMIHSDDDAVVSKKIHFDTLQLELANKPNIKFLSLCGKGHDITLSESAMKYIREFRLLYKKESKKLKTKEAKRAFVKSFDWYKMTEQDTELWSVIFDFLDS